MLRSTSTIVSASMLPNAMLIKLIGLYHQGGSRLAEVALHGNGDEIAAFHSVHPSTSSKASSMNLCISVSIKSA